MSPVINSREAPLYLRRSWRFRGAQSAIAAMLLTIYSGAYGAENSAAENLESQGAEAARNYLASVQHTLESSVVPRVKQGIIKLATTHPNSLGVFITEDPSPYHLAVTTDQRGGIIVKISFGYLAMHDAALDAVALSGILNQPLELRKYLRYQLDIARENEVLTKQGRTRLRAKSFPEFADLQQGVVQSIYARPQWQKERQIVGADSLGWVISYLLVVHDGRLSGDGVAIPASTSAARLAGAAGFFPAPPFSTAYHFEEVTNPGVQRSPDRRLLCRAADFLDAGAAVLKFDGEWQTKAAENEALRIRIQHLRDDVALIRRDARCTKRDSTDA